MNALGGGGGGGGWNDIILAVEFQLVHIAVHKAALQPSQECKLQQCSNRGDAGELAIQS